MNEMMMRLSAETYSVSVIFKLKARFKILSCIWDGKKEVKIYIVYAMKDVPCLPPESHLNNTILYDNNSALTYRHLSANHLVYYDKK
jgi:hypothetical protein